MKTFEDQVRGVEQNENPYTYSRRFQRHPKNVNSEKISEHAPKHGPMKRLQYQS